MRVSGLGNAGSDKVVNFNKFYFGKQNSEIQ